MCTFGTHFLITEKYTASCHDIKSLSHGYDLADGGGAQYLEVFRVHIMELWKSFIIRTLHSDDGEAKGTHFAADRMKTARRVALSRVPFKIVGFSGIPWRECNNYHIIAFFPRSRARSPTRRWDLIAVPRVRWTSAFVPAGSRNNLHSKELFLSSVSHGIHPRRLVRCTVESWRFPLQSWN
jgi:hypothetical protein